MQVFVRGAQMRTAVYEISSGDDVSALKWRIEAKTGIRAVHQILSIGGKNLQDAANVEGLVPREATLRLSMRLRGGRDDEQPCFFEENWFGVEEMSISQAPPSFATDNREYSNVSAGAMFGAWVGDFAIAAQSAIASSSGSSFQFQPSAQAPPPQPAPPAPLSRNWSFNCTPGQAAHDGFHNADVQVNDPSLESGSGGVSRKRGRQLMTSSASSRHDSEDEHMVAPQMALLQTQQPVVASIPVPEDLVCLHYETRHATEHFKVLVNGGLSPAAVAPHSAGMMPKVTIGRGQKGLAYDLDSVDEKVKRRLIKNRLSAERSRLRKNARIVEMESSLGGVHTELEHFRAENAALHQRLAAFEVMARQYGLPAP